MKKAILGSILLSALLTTGCKKTSTFVNPNGPQPANQVEAYFADNVLNRTFIVELATDNGVNKTADFTGYRFVLTNTTSYYDGPMTGTKDGVTISGTWGSNSDYSRLNISLTNPSTPAEFSFINRSWRFTRKNFPVMELAPWGSTAPIVLHMRRL